MKPTNKDTNKNIQNLSVLFVDGYNVINAWPELKGMMADDFEGAREKLNEYMFEYAAFYGETIYVVYDAYQRRSKKVSLEQRHHVNIVYTKSNQTADSYIEKKVKELAKDLRLTVKVVTSDWVQQRQILGSGGIRLTPLELKSKFANINRRIQQNSERTLTVQNIRNKGFSELKLLLEEEENKK